MQEANNQKLTEEIKEESFGPFTDAEHGSVHYLTKVDALKRSEIVSHVSYKLALALIKGGQTFHGHVTTNFTLHDITSSLFLDFKGRSIDRVTINNQHVPLSADVFKAHRIQLPEAMLTMGQNVVKVAFEAEYVTDCQGMQWFKDEEDGNEYTYSNSEPDHAHVWFPCFDQPDMKAPYELLVLAPEGWNVVSTTCGETLDEETGKNAQTKFEVTERMIQSFDKTAFSVSRFDKSESISTYLYAVCAGPYHCFTPSAAVSDPQIPMRVYCRQSLKKFVADIAEDWFRVSKHGIRYYEDMFSRAYPFGKLDQIFVPDYNMGAMEQVGCVIYNDMYITRGEKFTRVKTENIYNTLLHEISHMWFGNLVTMKWWDDLWLNESFANMISYMCMDEAPGLEDITLAWSNFLDESFWGLRTDSLNTSHPIAASCGSTADAEDIFDGISYGKGAAWLHQLIFFFGKATLKEGLKTYFEKYSFKNTVLSDFVHELSIAAKNVGAVESETFMENWADQWLKTAGCAQIHITFDSTDSKLNSLKVHQSLWNVKNTPENKLRVQKFIIALFDKDMKIFKEITCQTSDTEQLTEVDGVKDLEMPVAFMVNYQGHGYGKFQIDEMSLKTFETRLRDVKDRLTRKQIYSMLYDMIMSGAVAGSRVMQIIANNIDAEDAEDILTDVLMFTVPAIIAKYLPTDTAEAQSNTMFDSCMRILVSGRFSEESTLQMLVTSMIGFAQSEDNRAVLLKWFIQGSVITESSKQLNLTKKHNHGIVKKVYSSRTIAYETKQEALQKLGELDQSDMLGQTKAFCEAALPVLENKKKVWNGLFAGEYDSMSLKNIGELCAGFKQRSHLDLISELQDEFFDKIEPVVNSKAKSVAQNFYFYLQPNILTTDSDILKFENCLKRVQDQPAGEASSRLSKWLQDSIQDMKEKQVARDLSEAWEKTNKAKL